MLALVVLLGCPVVELLLLVLPPPEVAMVRERSLATQMLLALAMPLLLRVTSPLVPPPPIRCN